jgi:hypothetical protein
MQKHLPEFHIHSHRRPICKYFLHIKLGHWKGPCSMAMLECQRDLKGNWLTRPLTLSSSWQPWVASMRPVIAPLEDLKSQKATK